MRSIPLLALACVLAIVAGCANVATTSPAPASGSCQTAPDPGTPAGWGPPPPPAPEVIPYLINGTQEMTCGPNRLLFVFLDPKTNAPIADPKRTAKIAFFDLARDPSKPVSTVDTTFVWAIENERGNYIANVDFPEAGIWGAEITTMAGIGGEQLRMTFEVSATSPVVLVGQPAPATKTPTAADVGGDLAKISTDTKPDPALYRTSADEAVAKHQPFLIAFATPKFCQSAQCGPTLDRLKPFVAKYPSVAFIHVEPYQLEFKDGQLQPVLTGNPPNLTPADVTNRWGLLSEPWVFVVDRGGIVRGSFALIFSDAELTAALDKVK
jgi:hypothetical protein